ncbi:MAG: hypothetical protein JXA20_10655, partial [Spirochaetes bacterium]|nr:hypothetical protein [Spirochaetota bacterium]
EAVPRRNALILSWLAPIKEPSYYNVYLKPEGGDYRAVTRTDKTRCLVGGLGVRTKYWGKVTGVDRSQVESLPSNEVEVYTNTPPGRPRNVRFTRISGKTGEMRTRVAWDGASDDDGRVKAYRVYERQVAERRLLAETVELSFELPEGVKAADVEVRALDDLGAESETVTLSHHRELTVEVNPAILFPLGRLGEMYDAGIGSLVTAYIGNIIMQDLQLGVTSGFLYLSPARDDIGLTFLVPVTLYAGYCFNLTDSLALVPHLRAGVSYADITYDGRGPLGVAAAAERQKSGLEPVTSFGMLLQHRLTPRLTARAGADFTMIHESGDPIMYLTCHFGVGYVFENVGFGAEVDPALFENSLTVEVLPAMILPIGRFAEMFDSGGGGMVTLYTGNMPVQNLQFGLSVGFLALEGTDDRYRFSYLVPLLVQAGYVFHLSDQLSLTPTIRGGGAAIGLEYLSRGPMGTSLLAEQEEEGFEAMMTAGLALRHQVTRSVSVRLGVDFGMIYEEGDPMLFVQCQLGVGYTFRI